MAINQRLDLKQGQTLTMTPQLQQAIKLLQMSNIELAEFVEAELEKNPLLERDDSMSTEKPGDEPPAAEGAGDSEHAPQDDHGGDAPQREERELDTDFENVFTGGSMAEQEGGYDAFATNSFSDVGKGGSLKFDDPDFAFENNMAKEATLRDYLEEQIAVDFEDNKERAIARLMLDYLDESGYFRTDTGQLAERLGTTKERVEGILAKLQDMDPAGLFARNLSECLALQLKEQDRLDPAMQKLVENLDVLAAHDLKKLKSLCGVDDADLKEMISEIKALNPKPALEFDHFVSQTVVPDVLMRPLPKSKGGGWAVELNNDTLPRVLVNKRYYTEISNSAKNKTDKEYLSEQLNTANWLIKAMDQRAETILKTASEIILQQEDFFNYGVEYLKPLVLKDIAAVIGMHESTVSRVTSNKYIGTPRGVFELKYFFSSGVSSSDGNAEFSSEAVKSRIKTYIDAEPAAKILSDDDLVDLLKKEGIDIARRTVAKYREAMKIPSSVQRRRIKNT
ncbi:MAG TPA: RNA polymerase factor sigma-54 [Patescibacteria group bacterium]|nr:RNA polymerase factor sigma-54 [Patescibacteria group bacterium]